MEAVVCEDDIFFDGLIWWDHLSQLQHDQILILSSHMEAIRENRRNVIPQHCGVTPSWVVHRGSVTYIGSMLWAQDTDTHALIVQSLSTLLVSFFHPSDAPAGRLVSTEQPQGTTCICCSWAENLRETYTLISFLFLRSQLHRYISIKRCMIYFDTLWLLETICHVMKDFFFYIAPKMHLFCSEWSEMKCSCWATVQTKRARCAVKSVDVLLCLKSRFCNRQNKSVMNQRPEEICFFTLRLMQSRKAKNTPTVCPRLSSTLHYSSMCCCILFAFVSCL